MLITVAFHQFSILFADRRGIAGPGNFRDMYIFALTDDYLNFDQAAGKSIGYVLMECACFIKKRCNAMQYNDHPIQHSKCVLNDVGLE